MKNGERRLVVIMFADIQGYSAMLQENEPAALEVVRKFHDTFEQDVPKYHGTIIDFSGDGALCVFESSLGAIECAIDFQNRFQSGVQVPVRIAIGSGSVLFDRGSIYGDHVNITARIESMGVPGSILMSSNVHDDITNQPHIETASLGKFRFKNIETPLEVFAVANEGIAQPKKGQITGKFEKRKSLLRFAWLLGPIIAVGLWFALNQSKDVSEDYTRSLAVLPFNQVGVNQQFELFLYRVRFELHHRLSRIENINLLSLNEFESLTANEKNSNNTTRFDYGIAGQGLLTTVDQGTFQVELLDGANSNSLWTDLFTFEEQEKLLKNIPGILENVIQELGLDLSEAEKRLLQQKPTENTDAYKLFIQAQQLSQSRDSIDLLTSVLLLDKAIELDTTFALAYAEKASKRFAQGYKQYVKREVAYKEAEQLARKAIDLDEDVFTANSVLATVEELVKKNKVAADSLYSRAIKVNPNDGTAHRHYSLFKKRAGDYTAAEALARKSIDKNPSSDIANRNYVDILIYNKKYTAALDHIQDFTRYDSSKKDQFFGYLGDIYSRQGDFDSAIEYYEKRMQRETNVAGELGYCYAKVGKEAEALKLVKTINKGQYKDMNRAMVYAGLADISSSYRDTTILYLDSALDKSIGLNVICDHPFFESYRDLYCK